MKLGDSVILTKECLKWCIDHCYETHLVNYKMTKENFKNYEQELQILILANMFPLEGKITNISSFGYYGVNFTVDNLHWFAYFDKKYLKKV